MKWIQIIFYIFIISTICNFFSQATKRQILPKELSKEMDIVFFDNGLGCYWYTPLENKESLNVVFCFRGLTPFINEESNVRQIEKFFPGYHVIYFENPGIGISQEIVGDISTIMIDVYLCLLRYKKWNKIVFCGFHYGAVIQSELYQQCQEQLVQKPNWILQINGFSSMDSLVLHSVPWIFQIFFRRSPTKLNSLQNYKNISCPFYIFHSKNNRVVPFLESIKLYLHLKPKAKFIPLYGHEDYTLMSKENIDMIQKILHENKMI